MADPHHVPDTQDAYVRGSQHIEEQAGTFSLFMGMAKWGSLFIAALLAFLVLWFQPGGSFFGGLITAVVLLAVGGWYLRSGKKTH